MPPTIAIGMFTYNEEKYVAEAIESLLAQTHTDFVLVVLDDCSSDETPSIIRKIAEMDARVSFHQNPYRKGYGANYRTTFDLAADITESDVDYFAWAAGHDRHHPQWLEMMIRTLDENLNAALAYPKTVRISETGERMDVTSPMFDTRGLSTNRRITAIRKEGTGFGNIIYGLFRADILRRAGVFRSFLVPDTLLLWQLTLDGEIAQINEELWFRRFKAPLDIKRQKRNIYRKPPWYVHLPWPLVNTVVLAWNTVLSPRAGGPVKRLLGTRLSMMHLRRYAFKMDRDYPTIDRWLLAPLRKILIFGR
jgi:glycosyltransferase involved in cell wall biosynthesis